MTTHSLSFDTGAVLESVRRRRPVVHCLTNAVTMGRVADALAALGALPVMASAAEEAADMVERSQALLLNLGTPTPDRWTAARSAGTRAQAQGIPVIVDPVGCGATPWRTEQARGLLAVTGAGVIRGNAPEVASLARLGPLAGVTLRGVAASETAIQDTTGPQDEGRGDDGCARDQVADQLAQLAQLASQRLRSTVLITGRTNVVSDGRTILYHATGVAALERLVGAGDVLTAVIAACRAVEPNDLAGAWAGLCLFSSAARSAAACAAGPGSFWPQLLDALSELAPDRVAADERTADRPAAMPAAVPMPGTSSQP